MLVLRAGQLSALVKCTSRLEGNTSVLVLRAGKLSALVKCTSRLEEKKLVSNRTNLNRVSNNEHCKYYCAVLSSFGENDQLTIG